ncbi:hypothetical protein BJV78DRAFT_1292098 [Lactifluus subvellereus]|nr:hypothetical protein BJV78DRAFT_1292098 [Lactifluus subvellereus]
MYPRGRSRDVSPVALARQASEERRRNRISIMGHYPLPSDPEKHTLSHFYLAPLSSSPSPATTPFTLTPPDSAPLTAHPRARVVSSSLPSSTLVEKPPPQVEAVQRAREQARAKCRYETLARAEQVFATVLERSRRERVSALRLRARREDELKERERVTPELEGQAPEKDRRRSANHISPVYRPSFRVLARVPSSSPTPQQFQVADRFTYPFPVPSTSSSTNSAPMRQRQGSIKTRLGLTALTGPDATNPRSVSFDDVRASMGSVLFPIAHGESVSGKTRRESELLGTLLEAVRWEEGERWQRGGRVDAWTSRVPETVPECEACASASLSLEGFSAPSSQILLPSSGVSVTTSISITSRPISWLSFSSRKSTFSITTAQTSSPSTNNCLSSISDRPTPQHSCGCTTGQSFVAVDVNDTPLGLGTKPPPAPVPSAASADTCQVPPHQRTRKSSLSARTWLAMQSSVSSVLSAAARIQQAYVTATIATLTATDYTQYERSLSRSSSESSLDRARCPPSGWRAQQSDVAKFASTASYSEGNAVPYFVIDLVELESIHLSPTSKLDPPRSVPAEDPMSPDSPTSSSITIPPTYYNADRHIFNANPLHLLSRAQINSWQFRGAPGAMPAHVFCRPELFYRLEPGSGTLPKSRGGSSLKWGWRVVWDTNDSVEC